MQKQGHAGPGGWDWVCSKDSGLGVASFLACVPAGFLIDLPGL